MAKKEKPLHPSLRLAALAREIFEQASTTDEAIDRLSAILDQDAELRDELFKQFKTQAIRNYLTPIRQQYRKLAWAGDETIEEPTNESNRRTSQPQPHNLPNQHPKRTFAAIENFREIYLLDSPLVTNKGLKLRFATRSDIMGDLNYYKTHADSFRAKQHWMNKVADRLDDDKTVEEVFTEEELRALQEKTGATTE